MVHRIRHNRRLARLAMPMLALFALRAGVPVGFMPAAIAAGGPFVLCHGGSAATLALLEASASAHAVESHPAGTPAGHGHPAPQYDHEQAHDVHWDQCPLGVSFGDAPLGHGVNLALIEQSASPHAANLAAQTAAAAIRRYLARAPPA